MNDDVLESYAFEYNSCFLHYWVAGPKQRPLVIFVHGIGADHHMFDAQIRDLVQVCRVLVWDLRGHGQSQPKGHAFSVDVAAEDLLALLQHVGFTKAILVGVSIGGNIALKASVLAPDSIVALILVGTGNQWLALPLWNRICLRAMMLYVRFLPAVLFRKIFSYLASARSEVRTYVYHIWSQMNTRDFIEVWEAFHTVYQKNHVQFQPGTACSTLLACGQYDITANYQRQWDWWNYAAAFLHYVTVPRAGHLANCDNPAFFNQVLIEYIGQFVDQ